MGDFTVRISNPGSVTNDAARAEIVRQLGNIINRLKSGSIAGRLRNYDTAAIVGEFRWMMGDDAE